MVKVRIIIAGSRNFYDYDFLKRKVISILKTDLISKYNLESRSEIEIVSGTSKGADSLGEQLANEMVFKLKKFPADWINFGKSAGYKRNKQMAEYANESQNGVLIAFWDGISKGTKHMIDLANKNELQVYIIKI